MPARYTTVIYWSWTWSSFDLRISVLGTHGPGWNSFSFPEQLDPTMVKPEVKLLGWKSKWLEQFSEQNMGDLICPTKKKSLDDNGCIMKLFLKRRTEVVRFPFLFCNLSIFCWLNDIEKNVFWLPTEDPFVQDAREPSGAQPVFFWFLRCNYDFLVSINKNCLAFVVACWLRLLGMKNDRVWIWVTIAIGIVNSHPSCESILANQDFMSHSFWWDHRLMETACFPLFFSGSGKLLPDQWFVTMELGTSRGIFAYEFNFRGFQNRCQPFWLVSHPKSPTQTANLSLVEEHNTSPTTRSQRTTNWLLVEENNKSPTRTICPTESSCLQWESTHFQLPFPEILLICWWKKSQTTTWDV